MRFTIQGVTYDTAQMRAFATGDPDTPKIYMDQWCRVFVQTVQAGEAAIRYASTTEIGLLASRYCIGELTRATRHPKHRVDAPSARSCPR